MKPVGSTFIPGNRLARCYIDGCVQDDEVESLYEQVLDRGHGATPLRFLRSLATELSHQYKWDLQCVRTSRVEARRMLSTMATLPPRIAERMRAFRPVPVPVPAPAGMKSEPTSRSEQLLSDSAGCARNPVVEPSNSLSRWRGWLICRRVLSRDTVLRRVMKSRRNCRLGWNATWAMPAGSALIRAEAKWRTAATSQFTRRSTSVGSRRSPVSFAAVQTRRSG